jgi:glyoxylase-like metal-dependent hydrolase (beta-lactamase superfamily II)
VGPGLDAPTDTAGIAHEEITTTPTPTPNARAHRANGLYVLLIGLLLPPDRQPLIIGVSALLRPSDEALWAPTLIQCSRSNLYERRYYILDKRLQTTRGSGPMLRQVAEGVLIHESEFVQSNAVVVHGRAGVLLIDPGVHADEMACLAKDLSDLGQTVVAGFSTHPHWDHLLWHASFGAAPRFGTERCAATSRGALPDGLDPCRYGIPEEVSLDLLGLVTGLPAETAQIPWDGPRVRIIEHQAHAPGHAALLIEECGVLVAGDMLSDVLIPMLDVSDDADPIGDYLDALRLFEGVAGHVDVLVPGHGSIGGADQVYARIDQDRAYVHAVREAGVFSDPRLSSAYAKDWLPGVHERQLQVLAERDERNATRG